MKIPSARLWLLGGALAVIASAAPPTGSDAQAATIYSAKVRLTGQVLVSFHGDRAAGCEASFRCDVTDGTIRWTPSTRGDFEVVRGIGRHRLFSVVELFGFGRPGQGLGTLTTVQRTAADGTHLCADGRGNEFESLPVAGVGERAVKFGFLAGGSLAGGPSLATRCGGPLPRDVFPGLPSRTMTLRRLLRGPATIDLSGSTTFASGGLAGTAVSTIQIEVGRTKARHLSERRTPRRRSRKRKRETVHFVQVEYRVAEVTGSAPVDLQPDPRTCAAFDVCDLSGTLTVTPGPSGGDAYVVAYGRLPRSMLRRVVEHPGGPRPRKAHLYGVVLLRRGTGSLTAALSRAGAPACADTTRLRTGLVELGIHRRRVTVTYSGQEGLGASDLLRTRCPGPLLSDFGRRARIASGRIPLRAFERRRVTLHLNRGSSAATPGFRLRSRPDVTIVLERERPERSRRREISVVLGAGASRARVGASSASLSRSGAPW